jgi:hypothetical protein
MDRPLMFDTVRNLLLALLLLAAQGALILHQVDFDQHADGTSCQLCLAAQALDDGLSTHFSFTAERPVDAPPMPLPAGAPLLAAVTTCQPRAPPAGAALS